MHNHSYENEFNLQVNEISFSYERMGTKTGFEKEAKGNSENVSQCLTVSPVLKGEFGELSTWISTLIKSPNN